MSSRRRSSVQRIQNAKKLLGFSLDDIQLSQQGYDTTQSHNTFKPDQVLIGRGGSGRVTLQGTDQGMKLACKKYSQPQLIQRQFRMLQKVREQINQESKPNIIAPIYLHPDKKNPYFTMEYDPKFVSLDILLRDYKEYFHDECIEKLSSKLLVTIQNLHRTGIVHNDIKPGNLLVNLETCDFKLIDFGSSRTQKDTPVDRDHFKFEGTYIYTSPNIIHKIILPDSVITFDDFKINDLWATYLIIEQMREIHPKNIILRYLEEHDIQFNEFSILFELGEFFSPENQQTLWEILRQT